MHSLIRLKKIDFPVAVGRGIFSFDCSSNFFCHNVPVAMNSSLSEIFWQYLLPLSPCHFVALCFFFMHRSDFTAMTTVFMEGFPFRSMATFHSPLSQQKKNCLYLDFLACIHHNRLQLCATVSPFKMYSYYTFNFPLMVNWLSNINWGRCLLA